MIYLIKRNGKRFNNKNFSTYEQARAYARSRIRKEGGEFDGSNPPIGDFGFYVARKEA